MKINQGCKTKERCEITSNPPNRTIWFVDDQLWFADAAFCISKHPTSVKNHLQFRTFSTKSLHNPNKCLTFVVREPAKPLNDAQMCGSFFLIEEELNRSKEDFVTHFKEIYSNPYPPAWILMEVLPFGVVTNIYANIKNKKLKKRISQSFDLQVAPFESWLTIVAVTRNSCGHHSRIWNRVFSIRATIPVRMTRPWLLLKTDPLRVYFDMCIIKYFLDIISPSNDMLSKMQSLFAEYPEVDLRALGFPSGDWQDEPLWSTQS